MLISTPSPNEREAHIEYRLNIVKTIAGPGFRSDERWTRKITADGYDRCFYPQSLVRQFVAIQMQPNRVPVLASVKVPTLVVHGTDDPLISLEGGKDTAKAIPGAQLKFIEGMGHDLPHGGPWHRIVEAITAHTQTATL